MGPVGRHIQAVIQQVDRTGDQAERNQRTRSRQPDRRFKSKGKQGGGEHQQVFGPLTGPTRRQQTGEGAREARHYEY